MSAATRPTRRATRRAVVDDDSDDEIANTTRVKDESEDDFAPEPEKKRSPRKSMRSRKSTVPAAPPPEPTTPPPKRRGRPKKSLAPSAASPKAESSAPAEGDQTMLTPEPEDEPPAKPAARSRKSTAPRKSSIASLEAPPPLPTPKPSGTPERERTFIGPATPPLSDITTTAINRPGSSDSNQTIVKPVRPLDTVLEKPMDIVLKTRTMAMPVVEESTPKARIVIKHLVMTNFKSYAGRQEVGPFHASFTSVVGPNGSGKSNVIDSLLFVFGFRASKMRQGKISALIHNSAQHPDLDHCEVAVHFQEVMDQVCGSTTYFSLRVLYS